MNPQTAFQKHADSVLSLLEAQNVAGTKRLAQKQQACDALDQAIDNAMAGLAAIAQDAKRRQGA